MNQVQGRYGEITGRICDALRDREWHVREELVEAIMPLITPEKAAAERGSYKRPVSEHQLVNSGRRLLLTGYLTQLKLRGIVIFDRPGKFSRIKLKRPNHSTSMTCLGLRCPSCICHAGQRSTKKAEKRS